MVLMDSDALDAILAKTSGPDAKVPGGSAGNTIFGLAKLGMPTSFLGKLGKDQDGDIYKSGLAELGGDTAAFCFNENVHTARCLSLVTPDSERTMRTDLGAAATITEEDIKPEIFSGISNVHIEGYMLFAENILRKVLEEAKKAGCVVSLDLASFEVVRFKKDILPELLSNYVDIVFANEDEAREFCGDIPLEDALEQLSELCETAVVKMGKEGSLIKSKGKIAKVKANPVNAVDTTGAGDLWQTGFLFGFLNGATLEDCGKYGSILGAEVVQVMGAKISEERWIEIKGQIK
jgi:sugar/nucleoside kinase (ribokinase family)